MIAIATNFIIILMHPLNCFESPLKVSSMIIGVYM